MKTLHLFQSYMPESGIGQPRLKVKIFFELPFSPHIRIADMYSFYFSFLSLPCLINKTRVPLWTRSFSAAAKLSWMM